MKLASDENPLLKAAENGRLRAKLNSYLMACRAPPMTDSKAGKKREERIPNLAGFCRDLGCGLAAMDELRQRYPRHADYLCAVFEDEALNSIGSTSIWSTYFKERLGVQSEPRESNPAPTLVFEHDIMEDGE